VEALRIKRKKVIQYITKEKLTSSLWGCYGKQVEFHFGGRTEGMEKLHRSEGDINISSRRKKWQSENLNAETIALLAEDEKYFLKQSLLKAYSICRNGLIKGALIAVQEKVAWTENHWNLG
jgi:hypothetical protein